VGVGGGFGWVGGWVFCWGGWGGGGGGGGGERVVVVRGGGGEDLREGIITG